MTLIQGAGVIVPRLKLLRTHAVRSNAAEAVEELEVGCGGKTSSDFVAGNTPAAAKGRGLRVAIHVGTCSARVPRRLKGTARRVVWTEDTILSHK